MKRNHGFNVYSYRKLFHPFDQDVKRGMDYSRGFGRGFLHYFILTEFESQCKRLLPVKFSCELGPLSKVYRYKVFSRCSNVCEVTLQSVLVDIDPRTKSASGYRPPSGGPIPRRGDHIR